MEKHEDLIEDVQGGFRVGKGCVDQIFTLKQIGETARQKQCKVYVGFMDLEKAYDMVNREALWPLLNGIKSEYVNSLACVRVKGCETDCFSIDSGVRQVCIVSCWLFNVYMEAVMEEVKMEKGRRERDFKRREESRDCLPSCMQMTWFSVVSQRKA